MGVLEQQKLANENRMRNAMSSLDFGMIRQEPSMADRALGVARRMFWGENDPRKASLLNQGVLLPDGSRGIPMKGAPKRFESVMDVVGGPLTFAGRMAKTANKGLLKKAQEMMGQGADRDAIWKNTGWFKDVDGHWKFEIDDNLARLNEDAPSKLGRLELANQYYKRRNFPGHLAGKYPEHTEEALHHADGLLRQSWFEPTQALQEHLSHREAYNAYPELKDIRAVKDPSMSSQGSFSPASNRMRYGGGIATNRDLRGTVLHEIQHAIQENEGFASGGNLSPELQQAYWNKYAKDYRAGGGPELLDKSDQLSRVLQDLRHVDHINDLRNITQPRQLFNSMPFYEHSNTIRNALGPTPKRGPKYKKWSQDAGKMLADILEGKRQNSNIDKLMTQDRATIKKMVRNAEAKEARLYKKGVMKMRKTRKKMDETDPTMNQWDEEKLYDAYRKLAGEAEARNVQTRMDFTPAQRQAQPPWETLDVPEEDLLVRMLRGRPR